MDPAVKVKGPTPAQRKWVMHTISKWRPRLFLGEWFITTVYSRAPQPDGAFAECKAAPKYLEADIVIYPRFWTDLDRERREHTIIHELAHCVTAKVSLMLDDALHGRLNSVKENEYHIEQLTERIANMVYQQEW